MKGNRPVLPSLFSGKESRLIIFEKIEIKSHIDYLLENILENHLLLTIINNTDGNIT